MDIEKYCEQLMEGNGSIQSYLPETLPDFDDRSMTGSPYCFGCDYPENSVDCVDMSISHGPAQPDYILGEEEEEEEGQNSNFHVGLPAIAPSAEEEEEIMMEFEGFSQGEEVESAAHAPENESVMEMDYNVFHDLMVGLEKEGATDLFLGAFLPANERTDQQQEVLAPFNGGADEQQQEAIAEDEDYLDGQHQSSNDSWDTSKTAKGAYHEENAPLGVCRGREPHPKDVLSARGGGANKWQGNQDYLALVKAHVSDYKSADGTADKQRIAVKVAKRVRESGGWFVKQEKDGLWYEMSDQDARGKVQQALRQHKAS